MLNPIQQEIGADNIEAQIRAALHTKLAIPVQPTKLETLTVNDHEEVDSIVVLIGDITGVIPAYNAGLDVYRGGAPEYMALTPGEKRAVRNRLIQLLALPELHVQVLQIEGNTVHLSRRSAMWHSRPTTLRRFGVSKITQLINRKAQGQVTVIEADGAWLDIGGYPAWLPRKEISYDNPIPARVLHTGQVMTVQVTGLEDTDGTEETLLVSKVALLPDPWDNLDFEEGSIVRATVIGAFPNGYDYRVAFKSGLNGIARLQRNFSRPPRFAPVAVRIRKIDRKKKRIFGYIL